MPTRLRPELTTDNEEGTKFPEDWGVLLDSLDLGYVVVAVSLAGYLEICREVCSHSQRFELAEQVPPIGKCRAFPCIATLSPT